MRVDEVLARVARKATDQPQTAGAQATGRSGARAGAQLDHAHVDQGLGRTSAWRSLKAVTPGVWT